MGVFTRIVLGFFMAVLGFLMVFKTEWFIRFIGPIDFAERVFGGGGTRFFYKVFGTLLTLVGFIVMTNLFEVLFGGFILSLFGF